MLDRKPMGKSVNREKSGEILARGKTPLLLQRQDKKQGSGYPK